MITHSALSSWSGGVSSGMLRISLSTSPASFTRSCSFPALAANADEPSSSTARKHGVILFIKFMFMKFLQKIFVLGHPSGINSDHKYVTEVVKGTDEPAVICSHSQKGTNEWRLAEAMGSVSRIILLQSSRPWRASENASDPAFRAHRCRRK